MSERYDRHKLIPGWRQERLANAVVVVVGIGALGNEVTRVLAMSGVGKLIICDPDWIEESNLSRTLLFRQSDIGRLKVEAAAGALEDLTPGILVQPRPLPLIHGVGLAELRDASLVLGCLDSRSARLQLAGRCQLVRAAYIDGGTHPWGGEVRPYLDPDGPCYGCSLRAEDRTITDVPWSCLDTTPEVPLGSAAPSSALVGTWMGMLAVRFLMELTCPQGTLRVDGPRGMTSIIRQIRDSECPLHSPLGSTVRIDVGSHDTVGELQRALPKGSVPLVWEPIQRCVECVRCGFNETRWGLAAVEACPQCYNPLRPRTTLELDQAPSNLTLAALGVPPREILAVRIQGELRYFELNS